MGEKTLTRIARIFAKGFGAGCVLADGYRAQLAGEPPALRTEMKSAKRPSAFAKATARQDENAKIKPN